MDRIYFTINGRKYSAGHEVSVDTTLNEYIRRRADLRGTKYMCLEGGCGACVLNVRARRPGTGELCTFSVNSCLVAVLSCEGWDITTIEGIGNRDKGYNIIQTRLNNYFGSQCGYCSPGFVMSMYSLIQSSEHHLTEEQIEKSFGSNLCRCTGYRPILEAFKSFAVEPDPKILKKIKDIEDIDNLVCPKSGKKCGGTCDAGDEDWCIINATQDNKVNKKISLSDGKLWFRVNNIKEIFESLDQVQGYDNYMLVAGNTSRGAYPLKFYPKVLIDISGVAALRTHYLDVNLVLGANTTLTDTINLFDQLSKTNEDFWYLKVLRRHLEVVAHIPVRNIGTLAGNLILKHEHPDFQSDVFLLFSCVGAVVTLVDRTQRQSEMSLPEFLTTDIVGKVMTTIKLPPLSRQNDIVTYKIRPKAENAHAEVNGAFLFKFDKKTHKVLTASIAYGGINPFFTHAYNTEQFLIGRDLFTNETLQGALLCLEKEVNPDLNPPEPQPHFRRKVALALFYKSVIKLCPRHILNPIYACGATLAYDDRPPVSRSYQEYDTKKAEYPITQPLLKKEGLIQCAGEAKYNDDIPTISEEVFVSFVLSTIARGEIEYIDGTDALKIDGVIAVFTSKDIPGINTIGRGDGPIIIQDEELLASDKIFFYNQPVALVVAETQVLADQVSYLVKVKYKNIPTKPIILTIQDAIDAPPLENRLVPYPGIEPTDRGANVQKVIKGRFYSPRQYHHMMELHTTVTRPVDNGYEVECSAQWQGAAQAGIALLLNIPYNKVTVRTRRCGGGFGSKIFRHTFAAGATALVAYKLNRPCRMAMHMRDTMRVIGKRPDSRLDYEVGVDSNGQIQYMDAKFYVNDGMCSNENENSYALKGLKNCYNPDRWKVTTFGVITDAATNCFMRAPGDFEGTTAIEHIMERIAFEIKKDPLEVRFNNYRIIDNQLPEYIPMFLEKSDYNKRLESIKEFNAKNRWKKRGLRLNNMSFQTTYFGNYSAVVSVYHGDGSVIINAGGIEIGQGINTKLAQVAAFEFKIPVEKVEIAAAYEFATPNCYSTASSITTECVALCVIRCCEQILARLAPIKAAMPNATWEEVVMEADMRGILLQANAETSPNDPRLINYNIYGVAATEVEVDVLTGTKYIVRADILEDIGNSLNPALDVGQVEGAFVQCLSAWLMEEIVYNHHNGEIYTDRTWNYHIMGAKDIPWDYRVYLSRNRPNPVGILGSKAVGEPPCTLTYCVVDALRAAIQDSRRDSGYDTDRYVDVGHLTQIPSEALRNRFKDPNLTIEQLGDLMQEYIEAAKRGTQLEEWGNSSYVVSKVGVTALTKIQQRMYNDRDIKVNAVHPGYVATDMSSHKGPLTTEEGAAAPLFLALDAGDSVRGQYVWYNSKIVSWDGEQPEG